jgi:hypothetical protein
MIQLTPENKKKLKEDLKIVLILSLGTLVVCLYTMLMGV